MLKTPTVVCDYLRLQEMAFEEDGLRHEKREPHIVVVQCLAGRYDLTVDDRFVKVLPGEWYVANSFARLVIVHRRPPDGPMRARWMKMHCALHNGLNFGTLWRFPILWRGKDAAALSMLWDAMSAVCDKQDLAAWASLQRLAMELIGVLCAKGQILSNWEQRVRFHDTFSTLETHVDAHLSDPLTPASLARVLCVSESHLYTLFRRQVGMSPADFVKQRRIAAACAMLETTNTSVKQTAAQTGFANPYHFSREFRRICGVSPRTYRKQHALPARTNAPTS